MLVVLPDGLLDRAVAAVGTAVAGTVSLIMALLFAGAISLTRRRGELAGGHGIVARAGGETLRLFVGVRKLLLKVADEAITLGLGVVLVTTGDLAHELAGSLANLVASTGRGVGCLAEDALVGVTGALVVTGTLLDLVGTSLGLVATGLDSVFGAAIDLAAAQLGAARLV